MQCFVKLSAYEMPYQILWPNFIHIFLCPGQVTVIFPSPPADTVHSIFFEGLRGRQH